MKKGFNQSKHTSLIPDQYDMVYNVGMRGTVIDPLFMDKWNELSPYKRGIIHQPILSVSDTVNDNASAFLGLLNDLGFSSWNNGVPLIVDIWEAPDNVRYSLDNIRQHGIYITEKYKPITKPLLRVILKTWKDWYNTNAIETVRLTNDYNILLCQPGVLEPSELDGIGLPIWWEYDWDLYANDIYGLFDGVVKPSEPPVEEPVTPPEGQDLVIELNTVKKWKISLLGGLIKGTIEAVDENN